MSGNNKTFTLSVARVSTPGQVRYMGTQADNLGKNTVRLCGSAYNRRTTLDYLEVNIRRKYRKGYRKFIIRMHTFCRFSRNTAHLQNFRNFIVGMRGVKFHLVINDKTYRFENQTDFVKVLDGVRIAENESRAIGDRARAYHQNRRLNQLPVNNYDLNPVEQYFVRQIIFDRRFVSSIRNFVAESRGIGSLSFSERSIAHWRRTLVQPNPDEEIGNIRCNESGLYFAYPNREAENFSWQLYARFFPTVEVAKRFATTFENNNGVWFNNLEMPELSNIIDEMMDEDSEESDSSTDDETYEPSATSSDEASSSLTPRKNNGKSKAGKNTSSVSEEEKIKMFNRLMENQDKLLELAKIMNFN